MQEFVFSNLAYIGSIQGLYATAVPTRTCSCGAWELLHYFAYANRSPPPLPAPFSDYFPTFHISYAYITPPPPPPSRPFNTGLPTVVEMMVINSPPLPSPLFPISHILIPQLQQERIWTRVLEKVFEGDGMGEEVPGYGAELRLEDHCLSAEGVRCFWCEIESNFE